MTIQVGHAAPEFCSQAVVNGEFKKLCLSDFKGKKLLLFFYPLDFTFVCPTELLAFNEKYEEFQKRNTDLLACSVDSQFTHMAWLNTPREKGGIAGIRYPIMADLNKRVAIDYNVLTEDGVALRGLFLIDENGVIQHATINNLPLGRNVDEALRMVDALAFFQKHGEVCPANWRPGDATIKPNPKEAQEYFAKVKE